MTLKEDLESIESLKINGTIVVDLPKSSRGLLQTKDHPISAKQLYDSLKSAFARLEDDPWPSWQVNKKKLFTIIL